MLIRFAAKNFRSFGEQIEISMVANGRLDTLNDHVISHGDVRLLRGAFVYGANAAGKSNLIKAVDFAKRVVAAGSAADVRLDQYCKVSPGGLDEPGVFQFEMVVDGKYYSYGFAISYRDGRIVEEWLYQLHKSGAETCVFERDEFSIIATDMKLTGQDKTRFNIYSDDMKALPEALFLSEMAKKNISGSSHLTVFTEVREWFDKITVVFPDSRLMSLPSVIQHENMREQYELYMRHFGTGIANIGLEETTLEDALMHVHKELRSALKQDILQKVAKRKHFAISGPGLLLAVRRSDDGDVVVEKLQLQHENTAESFDLLDESDGTQRLFDLVPLLFDEVQERIVFIDEIERSMHPLLAKEFIDLFYQQTHNKNTQIVATTHEIALLDLTRIRRDEIWFVERLPEGSKFFSLDDYRVRHDKQIDKDYLIGRYGAVPHFSSLPMQVSEGCEDSATQT